MTQHSSLTAEKNLTSPTLDALCNDLDSFINELSISEPSSNNNNNSISHLNLDTATALV
jgi:hypothetical protein